MVVLVGLDFDLVDAASDCYRDRVGALVDKQIPYCFADAGLVQYKFDAAEEQRMI